MKRDFEYLKGCVFIIELDDDATFTADIKDELIGMMPEPTVLHEIPGGHLAMMFDTDCFMKTVNDFMDKQEF